MDLRSSRSRSKTPFVLTEGSQETYEQQSVIEESVVHHSYSTRSRNIKSNSSSDEVFASPSKQSSSTSKVVKRGSGSKGSRHKTSDYSSEEGENEITSSRNFEDENAHQKTNGQNKLTAFQIYKEAGEYWNKYPKTDYTYSRHSKDRKEVAPGVVIMPNMSRRSLHRELDNSLYSSHSEKKYYVATADKNNYDDTKLIHQTRLEPRKLFEEETEYSITTRITRTIRRIFVRIYMAILTVFMVVNNMVTPFFVQILKSYYKFVSRLLLFDTWLLLKNSDHRRLMGTLLAIFMLPLFLLTGWWVCSSLSNAIFAASPFTTEAVSTDVVHENIPIIPNILITNQNEGKENINVEDIVLQILANPTFENIIIKHLNEKQSAIKQQNAEINTIKTNLNDLEKQINFVSANNARLAHNLNKCCKRQYIHIEGYVTKILSELIGKPGIPLNSDDISKWLHSIFVAKNNLEIALENVTKNLHSNFEKLVESSAQKVMEDITTKFQSNIVNYNIDELTDAQIKKIVQQALAVYDADKTGMVDYALESSGGMVLSTRCTESYYAKTAQISIWGIPLWYPRNTPRTAILPDITPGNCWAFQGFPGFLVVQLSAKIDISAFSVEHIPLTLAPSGKRDSAPKSFSVFGLNVEEDPDPWLLGKYEYQHDGPALQHFEVKNKGTPFKIVELRIDSNHGNANYTCLYRFRVHGVLFKET